jgi:hypothetical protein
VSNRPESTNSNANSDSATLTERAAGAARAELRGERDSILGAIGIAAAAPLSRARDVPDRWSFLFVMERMEEGFRILSRLPLPTRPKGYVNSMPIYLYDQSDLNSQLETYELERLARLRNRVRILPSPAEIARIRIYSNTLDSVVLDCLHKALPVKLVVAAPKGKDPDYATKLKLAKRAGVGIFEVDGWLASALSGRRRSLSDIVNRCNTPIRCFVMATQARRALWFTTNLKVRAEI